MDHVNIKNKLTNNSLLKNNIQSKIKSVSMSRVQPTSSSNLPRFENKIENNKVRPSMSLNVRTQNNLKINNSNEKEIKFKQIKNQFDLLDDFSKCGGDLGNLKSTLREKKKKENSDIKKKVEQLAQYIQNTNSYISNICKNYTERYRRNDGENSMVQMKFNSEIKKELPIQFSSEKNNIDSDSGSNSKRRFSVPNFNYSSEVNNIYSTAIESSNENEEKQNNKMHVDVERVNDFSVSMDIEESENEIKMKMNALGNLSSTSSHIDLDYEQIGEIELINSKIKTKENDMKFMIENFGLIIENERKSKEDKEKMILDFEEREFIFVQKMKNLEKIIRNKNDETFSLNNSIKELMNELERGELHRRKLHNYIQELRGNIRVYCRVKPLSGVRVNKLFKIRNLALAMMKKMLLI